MILNAAPPYLLMWVLLCSDCAIRSGAATAIGNSHYDPIARTVSIKTKYGSTQTLPVTEAIAALASQCPHPTLPWMSQLPRGEVRRKNCTVHMGPLLAPYKQPALAMAWAALLHRCGITRRIIPHDLRRTTARAVYSHTHDLRLVQALLGHSHLAHTAWYLQDALTPVPRETLEFAKLNPLKERTQ